MGCFKILYNQDDYYPFGSAIKSRAYSSGAYKYGFNGMEKGDEINGSGNGYNFGARIYDGRLGRWMSLDPLFQLQSNYIAMGNCPVKFYDIDGKWVPGVDKDGNMFLIAQKGDNGNTLHAYFNNDEAFKKYVGIHKCCYKVGEKQSLLNTTLAAKAFKHNAENSEIYAERGVFWDLYELNYNCFMFASSVSLGMSIDFDNPTTLSPWSFQNSLDMNYTPIDQKDLKEKGIAGKTILSIRNDTFDEPDETKNLPDHAAIYWGTSEDGTIYVLSKNGVAGEPEVMKLSEVMDLYDGEVTWCNYGQEEVEEEE